MSYLHDYPHTSAYDGDLRQILDLYFQIRGIPKQWEEYQKLMNTKFQDLKDFVENYFDNLDVQQEINNKLDEMLANGYFDEIVRQFLFETPLAEYTDASVFAQIILDKYIDMSNRGVQGFAIGNVSGANVLMVACIGSENPSLGMLVTYNLNTGELLNYKINLPIGHANGITFCTNDGYFYIACAGGQNGVNKIAVYDHNIEHIKDIAGSTLATGSPYGIAWDDKTEYFYLALGSNTIGCFDYNWKQIRLGQFVSQNDTNYVAQSLWTDGRYLYFITNNLTSGDANYNKFDIYNLADLSFYRKQYVLTYGELESCCWFNGELYLLHNVDHSGLLYRGCHLQTQRVYEYERNQKIGSNRISLSDTIKDYWHDSTYSGFYVRNTQQYPFNKFYAMTNYSYTNQYGRMRWNIRGIIPHNINVKRHYQALNILGRDYPENGEQVQTKVGGVYFRNIENVTLTNVEITKRNDVRNTLLSIDYCTYAYLTNVTFNGEGTEQDALAMTASNVNSQGSNFISNVTRDVIHSVEGSSLVIGGTSISARGLFTGTNDTMIPYGSPQVFFNNAMPYQVTVLKTTQNFDITTFRRNGLYRIEGTDTTWINVPPDISKGNNTFEVINRTGNNLSGDKSVVEYIVTKPNGAKWRGILSTNGTIIWLQDYNVSVPMTLNPDFVESGEVYFSTTNGKNAYIYGSILLKADVSTGDVIATLNDSRYPARYNRYFMLFTDYAGTSGVLDFLSNKLEAHQNITTRNTIYFQGNYNIGDFIYP